MAKRPCELCQQSLTNDMRAGVYMCPDCIDLYSRALHREPDAVFRLSEPQNFPYATEHAKTQIIHGISTLKRYVKNQPPETATKPTPNTTAHVSAAPQAPVANKQVFYPYVQPESALDRMYSNIGKKIKNWAKWIFVFSAIAAVIASLIMIFSEDDTLLFIGLVSLFIGPIAAWVSSWILYGFGELIDKTAANEKHTQDILKIMIQNNSQNKN